MSPVRRTPSKSKSGSRRPAAAPVAAQATVQFDAQLDPAGCYGAARLLLRGQEGEPPLPGDDLHCSSSARTRRPWTISLLGARVMPIGLQVIPSSRWSADAVASISNSPSRGVMVASTRSWRAPAQRPHARRSQTKRGVRNPGVRDRLLTGRCERPPGCRAARPGYYLANTRLATVASPSCSNATSLPSAL